MNTTPLIDVMLALLIMFIITLPVMTKRAKYDDVAQVLGSAQRNGMRHIGFAGQEQFVDDAG